MQREVKEIKQGEEVEERNGGVAAFFDLDGTLVPLPSMEKRFFAMLRYRRLIGIKNYFSWLVEAAQQAHRGIDQIMHANKMYLRGVRVDLEGGTDRPVGLWNADETRETRVGRRPARMPVPLYPQAIERVTWHAARGHLIVLVSGTLEPLAERAARALEAEFGARELRRTIRVCSTRLEEKNERWTGRIAGEAMFGEAKARAIRRIAAEADLELRRCFAYGDSASDRWMLEAVGKPAAVNPSNDLARIARRNEWAILRWGKEKTLTPRTRSAQRSQEEARERLAAEHVKSGYRA
jgi:HAD superfamily hydrolase (TIGR01490 family)